MASTPDQARREKEAADWFARLNTQTIPLSDLDRFKAWRADPDCKAAYEAVESVWRKTATLQWDPDVRAELAEIPDRSKKSPRSAAVARWAAGATALVLLGAIATAVVLTRPDIYATGVGENRLVRLADGSTVRLDTDSRLEVRMGRARRDLVLSGGQAEFAVAHDVSRPFVVHAGTQSITALGTRFVVRTDGEGSVVTLVEGRVRVDDDETDRSWRLSPGEQLADRRGSRAAEPAVVDLQAETSWTNGRLLFEATPLAEAIAEINRYAVQPIVLEADAYRGRPLSGAFETGDPAAFAEAVARIYGLRLVERDDKALALRSG